MGRQFHLTSPTPMNGPDVEALQRALTRKGFYHGSINGRYNLLTANAACAAKKSLGYAKPDHIAGDLLYGYLTGQKKPSPSMVARAKKVHLAKAKAKGMPELALELAISFIGTKESPPASNHQQFGVWYGVDRVAWCNIFVSYCYAHVGSKAFVAGHTYSYVPYMDADARANRNHLRAVPKDAAQPGDPLTFDWPNESPGTPDHTGLFEKWLDQKNGYFQSVEGNTGIGNDSNGGEVMRRERYMNTVRTVIRVEG